MAERERIQKPAPSERETDASDAPSTSERGEEIKAELDDLLETDRHRHRNGGSARWRKRADHPDGVDENVGDPDLVQGGIVGAVHDQHEPVPTHLVPR